MYALAAPRRRHHRRRGSSHRRHRRRNPGLQSFTSGGMLQTVGGAAIGFFGSNALPALIPQLAQYNTGVTGYAIQAVSGLALSWGLKRFLGKGWGTGALIGTGLSILLRIVKDHAIEHRLGRFRGDERRPGVLRGRPLPVRAGRWRAIRQLPGNASLANPPFPARRPRRCALARRPLRRLCRLRQCMHRHGPLGVNSAGDMSRWT